MRHTLAFRWRLVLFLAALAVPGWTWGAPRGDATSPSRVRSSWVSQLLMSLDTPDQREIDALWAQEAEACIEAYERRLLRQEIDG